jgi:PKD repeat protein
MKKLVCFLAAVAAGFFIVSQAFAYEIPYDNSRAKYFYVFGPDGDPKLGAENPQRTIYIAVPEGESDDLYIAIYDPDTGGFRDLRPDPSGDWDTICEYAVYGADDKLLASEKFGESELYDRNYYVFGPYSKEQGTKQGDFYIFKLTVAALEGKDANLFRVKIYPYRAEAYSYDITIRLREQRGTKMYFYPQVPEGVQYITVENYDMDPDGGSGELYDPASGAHYKIKDSDSGEWTSTEVPIASGQGRRLEYTITKKTQKYAHAGLIVKDNNGNPMPIYFRSRGVRRYALAPPPERPHVEAPAPKKKAAGLQCNEFTFDATDSYDPDNQELSYLWDFGDGATSTDPIVTHTYQKAGNYTVMLTVKDNSQLACDTSSVTQTVKVNMPPRPGFVFPDRSCAGSPILFDASSTQDDPQDKLSYAWDFGDGETAEGVKVTKTYAKGGTYKVALIVDDNAGTRCSVASIQKPISVNTPPVAEAGRDIDMCVRSNEELQVGFDGTRSYDPDGDALTYMWDFGDGQTGDSRTTTHVYKKGGTYTVKLIVNDGSGSQCSSDVDTLTVKLNTQPVANAGPNLVCCLNQQAVFDGSGSYDPDGDALTYMWDFGDGTTAQGTKVTHAYTKRGTYMVTLKVDDNRGTACSTAVSSFKATVHDKPVAVIKVSE